MANLTTVDTILDLKALTSLLEGDIVVVKDPYRGGVFYVSSGTATIADDDGGINFVTVSDDLITRVIDTPFINVQWFTGLVKDYALFPKPVPDDQTQDIKNALDYIKKEFDSLGVVRQLYFPSGWYFIGESINLTDYVKSGGWNIYGDGDRSIITVVEGVNINGAIFNFNNNDSYISRKNSVQKIKFYAETQYLGNAKHAIDFSYNQFFVLRDCYFSRVATDSEVAVHFAWQGLFEGCEFNGTKAGTTRNFGSYGLSLSNEANAVKVLKCHFSNYEEVDSVGGVGLITEQTRGLSIDACDFQNNDRGIVIGNDSRATSIVGGGYYEKNEFADIQLGGEVGETSYNTLIQGQEIKSQGYSGSTANGLYIKGNTYNLSVLDNFFDNGDAIDIEGGINQKIQNVRFSNNRIGDTIYGYRNLVKSSINLLDSVVVENQTTPLNVDAINNNATSLLRMPNINLIPDLDVWNTTFTNLVHNGYFVNQKSWKKNNPNTEKAEFILSELSGLNNQVLTFSVWMRFTGGAPNYNDEIQVRDENNVILSRTPVRRLGGVGDYDEFMRIYLYVLVPVSATSLKFQINSRNDGIEYSYPRLMVGFVE